MNNTLISHRGYCNIFLLIHYSEGYNVVFCVAFSVIAGRDHFCIQTQAGNKRIHDSSKQELGGHQIYNLGF